MKLPFTRRKLIVIFIGAALIAGYSFCLPRRLFNETYSTVLEDRTGKLLSASIASDGQWRFPEATSLNEKFEKAIVAYEDKRFWNHPGVDVLALARAVRENLKAGRIVTGGSTLTMQVVRLSRENPSRTFLEKTVEWILATRLEIRYSKKEILNLYASHAPFGGNVVGIEAACWRYFGRSSQDLSWAEASLLAVLPNNPSLIHLSRNREALQDKRNRLLQKLFQQGLMDEVSLQLAMAEGIPEKPQALPRLATHLLTRSTQEGLAGQVVRSSIDEGLQARVEQAVGDHYRKMMGNQVFNAAAIVLDVRSGQVLAYVGNTKSGKEHEEDVDVINAPRSTGSILKPFLFAALLDEGKMLPGTLVPDVPTLIAGFAPKNFSRQYDGAIAADQALIRSLNIPAVHELRDFRYEKFYNLLKKTGMTTLDRQPDHYGLSLVLGGAEGKLWDIAGMYASCARVLSNYFQRPGRNKYSPGDFRAPTYRVDSLAVEKNPDTGPVLSASALWFTFEAMKELYRPGEETGWQHFSSSKPIAWKTGTSFGFRDGWAIGLNPEYVVGVWVGNADGEGRPGLTGTEAAAPLLFDIFSFLPGQPWFSEPSGELETIPVCRRSGQRAGEYCVERDTTKIPRAGLASPACKYHQLVHLSPDGRFRVHGDCMPLSQIRQTPWFVLPPVQEYYFKLRNLSYRPLPPYRSDCVNPAAVASMDLIYPKPNAKIFLPVLLDGTYGSAVFEATHRNPAATVYWHLDGSYIGTTTGLHQLALLPDQGSHWLILVDDFGETLQRRFAVISAR